MEHVAPRADLHGRQAREGSSMVVVMTLPFGRPLTVDDLDRLPDDGHPRRRPAVGTGG
jgi:hypothetical protein